MSGGNRTQKFVLVGPHAGKTLVVNGHQFVDGEYDITANEEQLKSVGNVFACYGAFPAEDVSDTPDAPTPDAGEAAADAAAHAVGSTETKADEGKSDPPAPTLAEAIAALDPAVDDHWTGSGLPAMNAIEKIMGDRSVTRADVEAQAAGYNREKAKAIRG